jgi:NAD(P)-dependent dehydrogenase (short-subunit alcohol dehydrogenase family)
MVWAPPLQRQRGEDHHASALITGASKGFGLALATRLVEDGWSLVIDGATGGARRRGRHAAGSVGGQAVLGIAGDVADPAHRAALAAAVTSLGRLDLLVNNASTIGPSPQPFGRLPARRVRTCLGRQRHRPLAIVQAMLPLLRSTRGVIVNVTSDAGVEGYAGWGGYGSSKAGLEQLSTCSP